MTKIIASLIFTLSFLSLNAQDIAYLDYQLNEKGIPFFSPIDEPYQDQAVQTAPRAIFKKNRKVKLAAGTLIEFELIESIPWERATVGRNLRFRVYRDVIVNQEILVKAGTMATGEIRDIIEATANSPEAVYIEIERVQAVDGQMIDLSGIQEKISTRLAGQSVDIPAKLTISGYVLNSRKILVE